jgi:Sugar (and other) transporter
MISTGLAAAEASRLSLAPVETTRLLESWKAVATNVFNLGGLLGTLLTIPVAKRLGRRAMFALYFAGSAAAILAAFGLDLDPRTWLYMYFPIGIAVFGVFGSFTYYLPELFPTRLRGTGSGFCYNAGRVFAAIGPFVVGSVASRGADALASALGILFWVGLVPPRRPAAAALGDRDAGARARRLEQAVVVMASLWPQGRRTTETLTTPAFFRGTPVRWPPAL